VLAGRAPFDEKTLLDDGHGAADTEDAPDLPEQGGEKELARGFLP
jgi:aerobic C4-dicarboxylate transport protein